MTPSGPANVASVATLVAAIRASSAVRIRAGLAHDATARAPGTLGRKLVTDTTHRPDQFEAKFGPEPPDADVDHVGARVEVVAPDQLEQLILRHRLAGMLHELPEQQELQAGQRHRALPRIGLHPAHLPAPLPRPPELVVVIAAPPDP